MPTRPRSWSSALGRPPMRVLLPPAWMTPVTLTGSHRHRALAQDAWRVHGRVEDGGGPAPRRRPAVDHEGDRVAEVREHPRRRRRGFEPARIGARGPDGRSEGAGETPRDRLRGEPYADRARPGG